MVKLWLHTVIILKSLIMQISKLYKSSWHFQPCFKVWEICVQKSVLKMKTHHYKTLFRVLITKIQHRRFAIELLNNYDTFSNQVCWVIMMKQEILALIRKGILLWEMATEHLWNCCSSFGQSCFGLVLQLVAQGTFHW